MPRWKADRRRGRPFWCRERNRRAGPDGAGLSHFEGGLRAGAAGVASVSLPMRRLARRKRGLACRYHHRRDGAGLLGRAARRRCHSPCTLDAGGPLGRPVRRRERSAWAGRRAGRRGAVRALAPGGIGADGSRRAGPKGAEGPAARAGLARAAGFGSKPRSGRSQTRGPGPTRFRPGGSRTGQASWTEGSHSLTAAMATKPG